MDVIHNKYYIFLFIIATLFVVYLNSHDDYEIRIITIDDVSIFDLDDEFYVYFGRPSCPECIRFQRYIDNNDTRLPSVIYYFNTDYWRKSEMTDKICKEFDITSIPSLLKIKKGKCLERIDISQFK